MSAEKALDLDCWQFHIGVLTGALRCLGASQDAIASLDWIRQHVVEDADAQSASAKLDRLIDGAGEPEEEPRRKDDGSEQFAAQSLEKPARKPRPPMTEEHKQKIKDGWAARRAAKANGGSGEHAA